jgi:predicted GNAT superfamily acetyltransferase
MTQAAPTRASVTVRDVRGADELRACQALQRTAWGITEDGYVVPVATMAAVQHVGGLILGAFDGQERLVGFAFAFLGKLDNQLILWSQLTGVHPAHQSTGVGRRLKFEQRRRASEMGLDEVAWAFDPLQASNAAFNLGVLGARSRVYVQDMYGARTDALNVGLASDRLIVEWSTRGETGGRTTPWSDARQIIEAPEGEVESVHEIPSDATHLCIQIPANLSRLKSSGRPNAARDWQIAVRQAFGAAFGSGYAAVGFTRQDPSHPSYVLERSP